MFSTQLGRFPPRKVTYPYPGIVVRSNPTSDRQIHAFELRGMFPAECKLVNFGSQLCEYFDEYDICVQGSDHLWDVLGELASYNFVRAGHVCQFATTWAAEHNNRFFSVLPSTEEVFSREEKALHGEEFCADALVQIKFLRTYKELPAPVFCHYLGPWASQEITVDYPAVCPYSYPMVTYGHCSEAAGQPQLSPQMAIPRNISPPSVLQNNLIQPNRHRNTSAPELNGSSSSTFDTQVIPHRHHTAPGFQEYAAGQGPRSSLSKPPHLHDPILPSSKPSIGKPFASKKPTYLSRPLYQSVQADFDTTFLSRIFVGNIPGGASAKEITNIFNDFGAVEEVFIPSNQHFHFFYAFVVFKHPESAHRALNTVCGIYFRGHRLRIEPGRPAAIKNRRPGSDGDSYVSRPFESFHPTSALDYHKVSFRGYDSTKSSDKTLSREATVNNALASYSAQDVRSSIPDPKDSRFENKPVDDLKAQNEPNISVNQSTVSDIEGLNYEVEPGQVETRKADESIALVDSPESSQLDQIRGSSSEDGTNLSESPPSVGTDNEDTPDTTVRESVVENVSHASDEISSSRYRNTHSEEPFLVVLPSVTTSTTTTVLKKPVESIKKTPKARISKKDKPKKSKRRNKAWFGPLPGQVDPTSVVEPHEVASTASSQIEVSVDGSPSETASTSDKGSVAIITESDIDAELITDSTQTISVPPSVKYGSEAQPCATDSISNGEADLVPATQETQVAEDSISAKEKTSQQTVVEVTVSSEGSNMPSATSPDSTTATIVKARKNYLVTGIASSQDASNDEVKLTKYNPPPMGRSSYETEALVAKNHSVPLNPSINAPRKSSKKPKSKRRSRKSSNEIKRETPNGGTSNGKIEIQVGSPKVGTSDVEKTFTTSTSSTTSTTSTLPNRLEGSSQDLFDYTDSTKSDFSHITDIKDEPELQPTSGNIDEWVNRRASHGSDSLSSQEKSDVEAPLMDSASSWSQVAARSNPSSNSIQLRTKLRKPIERDPWAVESVGSDNSENFLVEHSDGQIGSNCVALLEVNATAPAKKDVVYSRQRASSHSSEASKTSTKTFSSLDDRSDFPDLVQSKSINVQNHISPPKAPVLTPAVRANSSIDGKKSRAKPAGSKKTQNNSTQKENRKVGGNKKVC